MSARARPRPLPPSQAPGDFAEEVDRFLNYVSLEKGLSRSTQESYQNDLDQASAFLAKKGATCWTSVAPQLVAAWQQSLADAGLARSSLARKRTAVRMLARYLVLEEERDDDLSRFLESPKLGRRIPSTLTEQDVTKLLDLPHAGDPRGLRDRGLLELFYSSGLRVSEMAQLVLGQLNLDEAFVRVIGKGNKERLVPIGRRAVDALRTYLDAGRPGLVRPGRTDMTVFLAEHGGALTRQQLWRIVRAAAKRAGITAQVKPHLLRHTFATHLLGGGADLRSIQEMLGHASVSTTQIYTAVDARRLAEEHAAHHPRARSNPLQGKK